jgi:hypothetical protein
VTNLDGLDINDSSSLEGYKSNSLANKINLSNVQNISSTTKEKAPNLFAFDNEGNLVKNNNLITQNQLEQIAEEIDENDINNIIKMKKRQSTITYSQRMLKKADNLTKFNRKNHSEGNKHITNNDL